MEFVIADYNVCMTVTCHVPQAGSDFGRSCAPGARVDAAFVTEKAWTVFAGYLFARGDGCLPGWMP